MNAAEPGQFRPIRFEPRRKIAGDYRKLGFALLLAAGTLLAWTSAMQIYEEPAGMLNVGERIVPISLAQVNQYVALFSDETLRGWLPEEVASAALWQRTCYRFAFTAALVLGFFSLFCLGLQFDELKRRPVDLGSELAGKLT